MKVSIEEKPKKSGVWWVNVTVNGKATTRKLGAKKNAMDTKKKLEDQYKKKQSVMTFKDVALKWFEVDAKQNKPATIERYEELLNKKILPVFGNKPIEEKYKDRIKRADIRRFLIALHDDGKGLSKSSIGLVKIVISGVYNYAIDEELIQKNLTTGIMRRIKFNESKKEMEVYTPEELNIFLDYCKNKYPIEYPFFLCLFRTGIRLGEALALEWNDIDWNERKIKIQRSFRRKEISTTKNKQSRVVDISKELYETLKKLKKRKKCKFLFHTKNLKIFTQQFKRQKFYKIIKECNLKKIRPHDARHTFASMLLSNGVNDMYVSKQMGHHKPSFTKDKYGHYIPQENHVNVDILDEL